MRRRSLVVVATVGLLLASLLISCSLFSGSSQAATGETIFGNSSTGINTDPDNSKTGVGTQFKVGVDGSVSALRLYRTSRVTGGLTGKLAQGSTVLATVTFPAAGTGWQEAALSQPVNVTTGKTYTVFYTAPTGRYAVHSQYTWPKVSGDLTAVKGVYTFGSGVPTLVYQNENDFVDVVFNPAAAPTTSASPSPTTSAAPTTTTASPTTTDQTSSDPTTPPVTSDSTTPPTTTTTTTPATCDRNATNASTLNTQVSQATAGQTICLAAGDYGSWAGTNKAVTVKADPGVVANMTVSFDGSDAAFTLDGLSGMGGDVRAGAHDFTIRNSAFTSPLRLQGAPGANILIDSNHFDWDALDDNSANAKLFLWTAQYGQASGVTIQNNSFRNGELDGIHIGNGAGGDILSNHFENLCYEGSNHTDMLQTEGMVGGRIAGNLFKASFDCQAQGLTSYDSGTVGVTIEDNVIDIRRPWGIEWYSDKDSIIRNNTVVYYPDAQCDFNTPCGRISINRKSEDPAGTGTQLTDNLATVEFTNGSTGTSTGNVSAQGAVFVGPLDTWAGYKLAPNSPNQGKGARIP